MESVLTRAKRLVSASVGSALDRAEEASGARLMREALRQAERAIDTVRAEQRAQAARRSEALAQKVTLRARIATLDDHARFAKSKGRDDLAAAAITQQIACEAELEALAWADAPSETFDTMIAALSARHARMADDLATFEAGQRVTRAAPTGEQDETSPALTALARAEQAFYRALAVGNGSGDAAGSAAIASEVEALRRADLVAARLAALGEPVASGAKVAGKKKVAR